MNQRIIFPNDEGGVSVIIPADCGLTIEEIAAKDVPAGKQFKIVGLPHIMLFKPGGELARQFMDIKQLPNPETLINALKEASPTL